MTQFLIFDLVIAVATVVASPWLFFHGKRRLGLALGALGLAAAGLAVLTTTPAATLQPRTVVVQPVVGAGTYLA